MCCMGSEDGEIRGRGTPTKDTPRVERRTMEHSAPSKGVVLEVATAVQRPAYECDSDEWVKCD